MSTYSELEQRWILESKDTFEVFLYQRISEQAETISRQTAHFEKLCETISRYENGYKGGCYACEPVGELNMGLSEQIVALEAENAALREAQRWIPVTDQDRLGNIRPKKCLLSDGKSVFIGDKEPIFWPDSAIYQRPFPPAPQETIQKEQGE